MTRVMIVEDHTLVRQSLIKTVASEPGFKVVGELGDGNRAFELVREHRPDLVLLDINLPGENGLELAARLKAANPELRIVFLTMHDDEASIRRSIELGADGYIPKTASTDELLMALRAVAGGGSYLSPGVARRVMDLAGGRGAGAARRLTPREFEILRYLAAGTRTQEVAQRVFLSVKTVKNHLTSIYAKLGVASAAQAVAEAYRLGLVPRTGTTEEPPRSA